MRHVYENTVKALFIATLLLLITSNVFWALLVVNAGVTQTYQQAGLDDLGEAHQFLGDLVVKAASEYSKADIVNLVRQSYPDAFIVEEEDKVMVNNVTFTFKNGTLNKVY